MASHSTQPVVSKAPIADDISHPPADTVALRANLRAFLARKIVDSVTGKEVPLGSYRLGVYVFFDYDNEPIYVGQTRERLGGRIGRHLTNQRTDAVAMSVLDPFEVCDVELYPIPGYYGKTTATPASMNLLNALEAQVYQNAVEKSEFKAVLNEKIPPFVGVVTAPPSYRGRIVSDEVMDQRSHPDVRIARRAATLARLAQIVSERKVAPGLRRVLLAQATRLSALAGRRYVHFEGLPDNVDEDGDSDDEV